MESPLQFEFQGIDDGGALRSEVLRHVGQLEERFGRVTAGRVSVRAPSPQHQGGSRYEVNIRLALPEGREVNVSRTAQNDERYRHLDYALSDAFKRARRQLQDKARRMQGQVKMHAEQPTATVVRLEAEGDYGFLRAADGHEIYFHRNSVLNGGYQRLEIGTRVSFAEEMGEKGPQATTVRLLGKHRMRADQQTAVPKA